MLAKNLFGDDHEIRYDTIINHDAYSYLRISLEVPRGQKETTQVLLNGSKIGEIYVQKNGKKTLGYEAWRFEPIARKLGTFRELGRAVAAIISNFVK